MLCLAAITAIYLGLSSWLVSRYKAANSDQLGNSRTRNAVDQLSFCNGLFAVLTNMLSEIMLGDPDVGILIYTFALCLYLLVLATALCFFCFLLSEIRFEESDVEPKKEGLGEEKLRSQEGEMADLDALKEKEFVNNLENTPLKESLVCRDSSSSGEEIKDEGQQEGAMHDVEEPKEMQTGLENRDVINSEDDVGFPDLEEFTEIVKEDISSTAGENYGTILLKKVEKKLEMAKEKYREEYKARKEQENCLFSMLSREITRAELYCLQARENEEKLHRLEKEKNELYRLQARENEEKLRKLEEEKNELTGKLCAANVKSDLYRDLLHDANMLYSELLS